MREQDKSDPDFVTAEDDREAQVRVLHFLLRESPALVSQAEVAKALAGGLPVFVETDSIERALVDLLGAGLIYSAGRVLLPGPVFWRPDFATAGDFRSVPFAAPVRFALGCAIFIAVGQT